MIKELKWEQGGKAITNSRLVSFIIMCTGKNRQNRAVSYHYSSDMAFTIQISEY